MQLSILKNDCLTKDSTEKSIYSLTLVPSQNSPNQILDYQPGDWLTVQAQNHPDMIEAILEKLNLSGQERIELKKVGEVSTYEALHKYLEITQLNPAILNKLQRQLNLGDWHDRQQMIAYAKDKDILDLLDYFEPLRAMGIEVMSFLSPLAPRYYSIASANLDNQQVSILYRQVRYTRSGRQRFGVASNFLAQLKPNAMVEVQINSNSTFKMPNDSKIPMVMIGSGTGLAPFIGFMQQREHDFKMGKSLGEALLFYGEINRQHSLFDGEFERWGNMNILQCHYAFSREQKDKVYVQHRMAEQAKKIWALIEQGACLYVCGSQDHLAVGVKVQMLEIFQTLGVMNAEQAEAFWDSLREQKRLQQDVY